jgi:hypothetical protein
MRLDCDYNLLRDIIDIELKNFNKMISESMPLLKEEVIEACWITNQGVLWVEGLKKILQRLTLYEVNITKKIDNIYTLEGEFLRLDIKIYVNDEQIHHIGLQNRIRNRI